MLDPVNIKIIYAISFVNPEWAFLAPAILYTLFPQRIIAL